MSGQSSHMATSVHPVIKAAREATGATGYSHERILGFVFSLRKFETVADFGCGLSLWLRETKKAGAKKIRGYDIPELPLAKRGLTPEEFIPTDLSKPVNFPERFDLAMSVEVAEHLPISAAKTFVDTLTGASDWVLFAAAIPYQGGMGHINENWLEYWDLLFQAKGYRCYDIIRMRFWHDAAVSYYYRQNTVLYVKEGADDVLKAQGYAPTLKPPTLIHPEMYINAINRGRPKGMKRFEKDTRLYYRYAGPAPQPPADTQDITYGHEPLHHEG